MNTTISVTDGATPMLNEILSQMSPARINPRLAAAGARLVQAHLAEKESEGNKNGWPSQHFFGNAARSVSFYGDAAGATVTISQTGFALQYFGGTVRPGKSISEFTGQPTKYLTIPARAEAYGKRAGEFGNLKVLFGRNGAYALAADEGGATKKVRQGREDTRSERPVKGLEQGTILYWLVKSATIPADRSVLPSDEEFGEVMLATAQSSLARVKGGA